ncbi:MAG TPA: 4'-phosphopantetheinyl transferase superfamily protein [Flavobacterium sp.]|nr:4'-phosphopantetheinyl transferase superfamily protein [Flavobacterium sp.]
MTRIYYAYISEEYHENFLKNELVKFPTVFQEKIKEYRKWEDAQLSLLGRVLLLKGIKQIYGRDYQNKEIEYTAYNKPYFKDDLIQFNISHSGNIVVCAISDQSEIGIDIERIANIEIADFKSEFTENEWDAIVLSNNSNEAFFAYWTQKEAVIKSHGHGLSIPLKSFEILDNVTEINGEKYGLKELKIDEKYKCYIALKMLNPIQISHVEWQY